MNDNHAYEKYPHHRNWFNKLWVAERLGYVCGPSGVAPPDTNQYIVRPIYNLAGMGIGARFQIIEEGDIRATEPGYFWCERFYGRHISALFKFHHGVIGEWKPISAFEGFTNPYESLTKFQEWKRLGLDWVPEVPRELNELSDVDIINVEFIDGKVIEVQLRDTPDPDYDHFIPVWELMLEDVKKYHETYLIELYEELKPYENQA